MKAKSKNPGEDKTAGLTTREIRTCPTCGAKFSATSDRELCPVCVLLAAASAAPAMADAQDPVAGSERSSAETELVPNVRRFENYEVMLDQDGKPIELGRGAMGITYKALDVDLRCPVTLKVISEKYVGDERIDWFWEAYWKENGRDVSRRFTENAYGNGIAERKAREARRAAQERLPKLRRSSWRCCTRRCGPQASVLSV